MSSLNIVATVALSLVELLLILNIFILPFVRRNAEKKRQIKLNEKIASFRKGDKILLVSGIRAIFIKRSKDILDVMIAKNVIIQIDKHAVMGVYK